MGAREGWHPALILLDEQVVAFGLTVPVSTTEILRL
jgi:hypothetical protein